MLGLGGVECEFHLAAHSARRMPLHFDEQLAVHTIRAGVRICMRVRVYIEYCWFATWGRRRTGKPATRADRTWMFHFGRTGRTSRPAACVHTSGGRRAPCGGGRGLNSDSVQQRQQQQQHHNHNQRDPSGSSASSPGVACQTGTRQLYTRNRTGRMRVCAI